MTTRSPLVDLKKIQCICVISRSEFSGQRGIFYLQFADVLGVEFGGKKKEKQIRNLTNLCHPVQTKLCYIFYARKRYLPLVVRMVKISASQTKGHDSTARRIINYMTFAKHFW